MLVQQLAWPLVNAHRRKPRALTSRLDLTPQVMRGLQGAWMLGEGGGKEFYDEVGTGTLTATGGGTGGHLLRANAPGSLHGPCIQLSSASSEYLSRSWALVTTHPLTISVWFRATTLADSTYVSLHNSANSHYFTIQAWSDGQIYGTCYDLSTAPFATGPAAYSANVWNHAAMVYTSSISRVTYLNGAAGAVETTSCNPTGMDTLSVGRNGSSAAEYANGRLELVMIWNRALNADEVDWLSQRQLGPYVARQAVTSFLQGSDVLLQAGATRPPPAMLRM